MIDGAARLEAGTYLTDGKVLLMVRRASENGVIVEFCGGRHEGEIVSMSCAEAEADAAGWRVVDYEPLPLDPALEPSDLPAVRKRRKRAAAA